MSYEVLEGERWRVDTGDCLPWLLELEPGSVDFCLTDPPYGIGWERASWDDDPAAYPAFMRSVVLELERVMAGGPVFMYQALLNAPRWHEWLPKDYRIFAACKGFVQYRPTPMQWSWDPVIVWGKLRTEPRPGVRDWAQANPDFGDGNSHQCAKPLGHLRYIIANYTLPGDIIIDPFCGSGTTGTACLELERRFLGCELELEKAEQARERIGWAARGLKPPKPATPDPAAQGSLFGETVETDMEAVV